MYFNTVYKVTAMTKPDEDSSRKRLVSTYLSLDMYPDFLYESLSV